MQRVGHRLVVDVRQIDEHPDSIHLQHDPLAERREPAPGGIGGRGRPLEAAPVRQRHVARAEVGEHSQRAERVLDGVAAFDPDETGDLAGGKVALHVGGGVRHRHAARIAGAEAANEVDLLERIDGRV